MTRRRRYGLAALALLLACLAGYFWRPVWHLASTMLHDRGETTTLPDGYADDASRLNLSQVAETWRMPVDAAEPERQLAQLLARARESGRKVSIAGARHSMGGHTIYPDGILIDMRPWNRLTLDAERKILTAQAGAVWKEIIEYLDPHGLSVAVMQSNDSFTIGGSLSVNCHGWQYDRPPIASTVESFRLMRADGTIVHCSRSENQELFSLVLGGYGLFGILLDAQLRVVPNELYRLEQHLVPIDQSLATFDRQVHQQADVEMIYARMNIVPDHLFDEVIINALVRTTGDRLPPLEQPGLTSLRRAIFRGSAESDYGKELRWSAETKLQPALSGRIFSRNQLLHEGVETFQNRSSDTTDILHEYFVPRERVVEFVAELKEILPRHRANLLNVTVRSVNPDDDTFLRYADRPLLAFVMLYVQPKTSEGEAAMQALTRELIDTALAHQGRYYLPYRLHATPEQFERAYPMARQFFDLKRKYDPDELFQNRFYLHYGQRATASIGGSTSPPP